MAGAALLELMNVGRVQGGRSINGDHAVARQSAGVVVGWKHPDGEFCVALFLRVFRWKEALRIRRDDVIGRDLDIHQAVQRDALSRFKVFGDQRAPRQCAERRIAETGHEADVELCKDGEFAARCGISARVERLPDAARLKMIKRQSEIGFGAAAIRDNRPVIPPPGIKQT